MVRSYEKYNFFMKLHRSVAKAPCQKEKEEVYELVSSYSETMVCLISTDTSVDMEQTVFNVYLKTRERSTSRKIETFLAPLESSKTFIPKYLNIIKLNCIINIKHFRIHNRVFADGKHGSSSKIDHARS